MDQGDYAEMGSDVVVQRPAILGLRYRRDASPVRTGSNCIFRAFTTLYADVVLGDGVQTGHYTLVREKTTVGNVVTIGTGVVIDGYTTIGSYVKLETNVYVPSHTSIGSYVFVGPGAVLTNDRYPLRQRDAYTPEGPSLEDHVTVGGGAIVLPGVSIGFGAFVAAGALVTKDVPAWTLAVGAPARLMELPERLREENRARSW